ncbi:MAG: hypothetical protein K0Q73_7002, partial [Paenibacillus sp.]|nr:hypothetical protein [Paenibacillus sp.]
GGIGSSKDPSLYGKLTILNRNQPSSHGIPGKPVLSDDNGQDTGILDGDYHIKMDMWWGENGKYYKLYENDRLIDTRTMINHSPNAQTALTSFQGKPNGTYHYFAELINEQGTTRSDTLTVTVSQANPSNPVLSNDNWDGDGQFQVHMNMWWGTNGSTYRLYENGVLIDTQPLAGQTPQAQSAVTFIHNKQMGVYEYRAELVNDSGVTSSETMNVHVAK